MKFFMSTAWTILMMFLVFYPLKGLDDPPTRQDVFVGVAIICQAVWCARREDQL